MIDTLFPHGYIVVFLGLVAFYMIGLGCGVLISHEKGRIHSALAILAGVVLSFFFYHIIGVLTS